MRIQLDSAPVGEEGPVWTEELERKALPRFIGRDNATISFTMNGADYLGTAIATTLEGEFGNWDLRAVLISIAGGRMATGASYHFRGEPKRVSGRPIHPRLPVSFYRVGVFSSHEEVQDAISDWASEVDSEALKNHKKVIAEIESTYTGNPIGDLLGRLGIQPEELHTKQQGSNEEIREIKGWTSTDFKNEPRRRGFWGRLFR